MSEPLTETLLDVLEKGEAIEFKRGPDRFQGYAYGIVYRTLGRGNDTAYETGSHLSWTAAIHALFEHWPEETADLQKRLYGE